MEEIKITYKQIEEANKTIKPMIISRKNKETGKVEKKGYAEVHQRIKAFRMVYPRGAILTNMLSNENGVCIFNAVIHDEKGFVLASATAQENIKSNSFINQYNAIENCETSAVGRALGFAGFGVDTSLASAEEVQISIKKQEKLEQEANLPMTEEQIFMIANLETKYKDQLRKFYKKDILDLTREEADSSLNSLKAKGIEIKTKEEAELDRKKEEEVF